MTPTRNTAHNLENLLHNSNNGDIMKIYRRSTNRKAVEIRFRKYVNVLVNNASKTFEGFKNIKHEERRAYNYEYIR